VVAKNGCDGKLEFKLFDVVALTWPSFTVTIPGCFITSWDIELEDSGVGFDYTGVSLISSADTTSIYLHVATCEIIKVSNNS